MAAVQAIQEATVKGSVSLIEAYTNNLHILDAVEDSLQVICMTRDEWHQVQCADPVLSLVIMRLQNRPLSQSQLKTTDPPKL